MTIITTIDERRCQKRVKFERKLLRELSLPSLRNRIQDSFFQYVQHNRSCEDYCLQIAVESYLLGARYSKFGYYGETLVEVKHRCRHEERHLAESLFDFFIYEPGVLAGYDDDALYVLCQDYVSFWWNEGFEKGKRRYKLRLP